MQTRYLDTLKDAPVGANVVIDGVALTIKRTTTFQSCKDCAFREIRRRANKQALQCPAIKTCVKRYRKDKESVYYYTERRTGWAAVED